MKKLLFITNCSIFLLCSITQASFQKVFTIAKKTFSTSSKKQIFSEHTSTIEFMNPIAEAAHEAIMQGEANKAAYLSKKSYEYNKHKNHPDFKHLVTATLACHEDAQQDLVKRILQDSKIQS